MKRQSWVFLNFLETVQYFCDRGSTLFRSFKEYLGKIKLRKIKIGIQSIFYTWWKKRSNKENRDSVNCHCRN